jgi:spore coat protein YsxE
MAQISKILASYAVSAAKTVQVTNNLWQIDDGHSNYALKRSKLNPQSVRTWENVLHTANSRHITHILPVYLTVQHALYTTADNAIYYLTPWIETEEGSIDRLYHGLGSLHVKTKQSYPAGKENNSEAFLAYKNHCRQADEFLLQCVERFEKNRYMSPFELQVCMQYCDLELAGRQREKHIDQFLKEQEDRDHKWNYSLCHGNVT